MPPHLCPSRVSQGDTMLAHEGSVYPHPHAIIINHESISNTVVTRKMTKSYSDIIIILYKACHHEDHS